MLLNKIKMQFYSDLFFYEHSFYLNQMVTNKLYKA